MVTSSRSRWLPALAIAALAVALATRLPVVFHGLPDAPGALHPDEYITLASALKILASRTLAIDYYYGLTYFLLLAGAIGLRFAVGLATGSWTSPEDFAALVVVDPAPLYLLGRCLSLICFLALALLLVGRLARSNPLAAALAGGWLLLSPTATLFSSAVKLEMFLALLLASSLLSVGSASQAGGSRSRALAIGLLFGLLLGTKPNSLPFVVSLVAWPGPGGIGLVAAGLLLGLAPTLPHYLRGDLRSEWIAALPSGGTWENIVGLGRDLLVREPLGLVLFVAGSAVLLLSGSVGRRVRLGLVVPAWAFLLLSSSRTSSQTILLHPGVLGIVFLAVAGRPAPPRPAGRRWLAPVLAVALVAQAAAGAAWYVTLLEPDSRAEARRWIEANVPAGAAIGIDFAEYEPFLLSPDNPFRSPTPPSLDPSLARAIAARVAASGRPPYRIGYYTVGRTTAYGYETAFPPVGELGERFGWVLESSAYSDRHRVPSGAPPPAGGIGEGTGFYRALDSAVAAGAIRVAARFGGGGSGLSGPTITVYELKRGRP